MASLAPKSGTLSRQEAAHLLRRCSYNVSRERIDEFTGKTVYQAVTDLVKVSLPSIPEPIDPETGEHWINSGSPPTSAGFKLRHYVRSWWTHEALLDPTIGHKMMFFLHTNFVVSANAIDNREYFDYLQLLRHYAIGNYRELAEKIVVDNSMLRYLDNTLNNKDNPNENFAREYLELFTIGKGPQIGPGDYTNYTEDDVAAAARVLTGFKRARRGDVIDDDTGIPSGYANFNQHDTGKKTFSAAFQNKNIFGAGSAAGMFDELSEFIDMIFDQPETARALCRKLYRFFVSRYISDEVEQDFIIPLADLFIANQFSLTYILKRLLRSEHFYDADDSVAKDQVFGSLIKSPLELLHGAMSFFKIDIPDPVQNPVDHYDGFYRFSINNVFFPQAGFSIFYPAVVAGYPAYFQEPEYNRNWFNATTIIARYTLPRMLLTGRKILSGGTLAGVQLDIVHFIEQSEHISNPLLADILVQELLDYMLVDSPDAERFNYFLNDAFLDGLPAADWTYEWEAYELTGDATEVRIPLENLVIAIMYSPEYQVF
ncbi:MAG: DUF1800 family protein [Bacteroidota bacterium]